MTGKMWPATLLPARIMFHPDLPSGSGGVSGIGAEQVVQSSAGRWRAEASFKIGLSLIGARSRDRILAARAMTAWMKGKSNVIFFGPYDDSNAPSALAGSGNGVITGIPHSDTTLFSDGTGYSQLRTSAHPYSAAAKGASTMEITTVTAGHRVDAGQYFGFNDDELYLIDSVVQSNGWVCTFWPPLRKAHLTTDCVNFDNPTCAMRAAADDTGQIAFERMFRGEKSLSLVEAL